MPIMPDSWIRDMARSRSMIEPFVEAQRREGVISFGLSSYGYDARVADDFRIFTNVDNAIVDPKDFSEASFVQRQSDVCIIPPNSFVLARTVEYFRIPRDVLVICLGKSTYARCGIIVNVTPLEPEWEGHVTLEFSRRSDDFIEDAMIAATAIVHDLVVVTRNVRDFEPFGEKTLDPFSPRPRSG